MGFLSILASFESQIEDQHLRGKLGNLTQIGMCTISKVVKSKNSGITFRISGQP
jgi:hypothetical protein